MTDMSKRMRKASGDDIVMMMDKAIDNFVHRNGPQLVNMYQQRAGRTVDTTEMDNLPEEFADFAYDNLLTGPEGAEAVRRFVNFHLNDVKLAELMDEFVEQKRPIQGYTPPPVVASELRAIADRIDASKNPDRTLVASAIRKVLFVLK